MNINYPWKSKSILQPYSCLSFEELWYSLFLSDINDINRFSQLQLIHVHVIFTLPYLSSPQSFETLSTFEAWLVLDIMLNLQMFTQMKSILEIKR